jgi:hypothetical protein
MAIMKCPKFYCFKHSAVSIIIIIIIIIIITTFIRLSAMYVFILVVKHSCSVIS